jgi:hypothetical protein
MSFGSEQEHSPNSKCIARLKVLMTLGAGRGKKLFSSRLVLSRTRGGSRFSFAALCVRRRKTLFFLLLTSLSHSLPSLFSSRFRGAVQSVWAIPKVMLVIIANLFLLASSRNACNTSETVPPALTREDEKLDQLLFVLLGIGFLLASPPKINPKQCPPPLTHFLRLFFFFAPDDVIARKRFKNNQRFVYQIKN